MRVDVVGSVTAADTAAVWRVYDEVFHGALYDACLVSTVRLGACTPGTAGSCSGPVSRLTG